MGKYVSKELLHRQTTYTHRVSYFSAILVLIVAAVFYFLLDIKEYLHWVLIPFSVGAIINILLFKVHKTLFFTYLGLILLSYASMVGITLITGGIKGHFVFTTVLLPLSAFITSKKQGKYWLLITIVTIFGIYMLDGKINLPNVVPVDYRSSFALIVDLFVILLTSLIAYSLSKTSFTAFKAKDEIKRQSEIIESKNKEIMDSISYGRKIQQASLVSKNYLNSLFKEHFVYYQPKDIVSGDFYWAYKTKSGHPIWVTADCTGHGVPGAFMSLIGISLLNELVIEEGKESLVDILNGLSKHLVKALKQSGDDSSTKDGMDLAICTLDKEKNELRYCGAHNPLYIVRGKELIVHKGTNKAIGFNDSLNQNKFQEHIIPIEDGDMIYTFSDGYCDQKGGELGKKLLPHRFKDILMSMASKPLDQQLKIVSKEMSEWKKDHEQVDDMLVMGVRV